MGLSKNIRLGGFSKAILLMFFSRTSKSMGELPRSRSRRGKLSIAPKKLSATLTQTAIYAWCRMVLDSIVVPRRRHAIFGNRLNYITRHIEPYEMAIELFQPFIIRELIS